MTEDTASAQSYLKASFLSAAVLALWNARQEAGLTQTQVAERLGTRQSAIARMEADFSGSRSLHRYVDYCIACEVLPFNIQLKNINALREFTHSKPEAMRTVEAYNSWTKSIRPTVATTDPLAIGSLAQWSCLKFEDSWVRSAVTALTEQRSTGQVWEMPSTIATAGSALLPDISALVDRVAAQSLVHLSNLDVGSLARHVPARSRDADRPAAQLSPQLEQDREGRQPPNTPVAA